VTFTPAGRSGDFPLPAWQWLFDKAKAGGKPELVDFVFQLLSEGGYDAQDGRQRAGRNCSALLFANQGSRTGGVGGGAAEDSWNSSGTGGKGIGTAGGLTSDVRGAGSGMGGGVGFFISFICISP